MQKLRIIGMGLVIGMLGGTAWAGEGKILDLTGEAYIATKNSIQKVKAGMACEAGDMIVTHEGCTLDFMVNGQAACRLLPNTTAVIGSLREKNIKLLIAEGNIVLNVKKLDPQTKFAVDTPTCVAAVRGTQFWGRVAGKENTTVTTFAVKEGAVEVTQKETNQTVMLNVGQAIDLAAAPSQPRPATPDEMAAMKAADDLAKQM